MDIRPAARRDIDTLVDQWVALATEQRRHGSHLRAEDNRGAIREAIAERVVADGVRVAADTEGTILGFVMVSIERGRYAVDSAKGVIENLYVVPSHRGEGIGTALLEAAEATLRDRGADRLSLEVLADNAAARRFYSRHGYAPHRIELTRSPESDTS